MEKNITINGYGIEKFIIVYPAGKAIEKHLAEELSRKIAAATEKTVRTVSDEHATAEREIRFGNTNRTTAEPDGKNTYKITVKENCVEAVTDCVFGYDDIMAELDRALAAEGALVWNDGDVWTGDVSNAPVIPEKYDLCLMYHNILGYLPWYPVVDRTDMQLEFYKEYMPDIIGLQEVSRFYYKDFLRAVKEMQELGYEEIRFPRYGYGNPIYYNAKKLMLIECGYKAVRAGDKGSTWAVFRIKRTDKTFAVINSHFAADSNASSREEGNLFRIQDAGAVVEITNMTLQRYPGIPVFAGGDYNSALGSGPINTVLNGGLISIRDAVEDKTYCDFCAYNGYPKYYEEENRYGYEEFHYRDAAANIDFIMLGGNQEGVKILDYILLKDRISCTVSDHLPHLCHLTLPGEETAY